MTLDFFERFRSNVEKFPSRIALQSISDAGRETFTYQQAAEEIRKISLFLQASGIRPGDAVGLLMENRPRWGIAFLAVQSTGAVVVPLDILHHSDTLAGLIQHAECRFLILSERMLPAWKEIQRMLPAPLPALVTGGAAEGCGSWETVLEQTEASAPLPLVPRGIDDDLIILYTSGTTGNPKGVVLTQRNVYRNVVEILQAVGASENDHFLSVLPLYHVLALMMNFIIPLYLGGRVTYLQVLEAQRILKTFREEGITIFVCVPQFYYLVHRRILQEVERQGTLRRFLFRRLLRLSRIANKRLGMNPGRQFFRAIHERFGPRFRLIGVGGARFDREIAESFRDLGFSLAQAYGLTETAALVTAAPPVAGEVGSVGRPLPHVRIRIDEPDENGVGEVVVTGENVMRAYWKNPEATAEAIRDGWFHTGDLGYVDSRGCLHITGRKKDVIVLSSGKNIFPEEVEHFYQSNCPLIKQICVLGIPDPASGKQEEQLHAVIVPDFDCLRSRQIVNAYDAIRWEIENLSQRLPPYKRVRSLEIRTEPLPFTTTRKLKRFEVQRDLMERRGRQAETRPAAESRPETPLEKKIFGLIAGMKPRAAVQRSMNLELDLGFGSLERVELLHNVQETFGIEIPEEEAANVFTVQDLLAAVESLQSVDTAAAGETRSSWKEILEAPLEADDVRRIRENLARRRMIELLYFVLAKSVRLVFLLLFRLRFKGRENLPREYPFLICPNHVTYLDPFFVLSGLPYRVLSRLFFLGDSNYFSGPVTSLLARLGKVIPVNPDRGPRLSLRVAAEGLRKGLVLCVFPEGERSIDGALKTFRMGPAILVTDLGAPAVPVGISGAWEVWPRGSNKIRLRPVSVSFGEPLPPSREEDSNSFNGRLSRAVVDLAGPRTGEL